MPVKAGDPIPAAPLFQYAAILDLQRGPGAGGPWRYIALAVLIVWLPLVLLSLLSGSAWGEDYRAAMLKDAAMHAHYLVALPLLLLSPRLCSPMVTRVLDQFVRSGLVREAAAGLFTAEIATTLRLRDSRVAIWAKIGVVGALAVASVMVTEAELQGSWRLGAGGGLSPAGWWLTVVSNPLYQFVLLSFVYRLALWWRLLWKVSRLDLQIRPAHGDGAGGLAFLSWSLPPLALPALAVASSMAGGVANVVLLTGASLVAHRPEILAVVALIAVVFIGPLLFFVPPMSRAKRCAQIEYGVLASRQLREFQHKWLDAGRDSDALTPPDFSAVIDYNSVVANVQRMRMLPFELPDTLPLVSAALVPFVAVATLEVPLADLLLKLWNALV